MGHIGTESMGHMGIINIYRIWPIAITIGEVNPENGLTLGLNCSRADK